MMFYLAPMWDHEEVQWIPILAFILLGLIFCDKALRPGARRTWAWGRTGDGAQLSRLSYAMWGLTFFAIAFAAVGAPKPGLAAVAVIAFLFVSVIACGFADTRAARRSRASQGRSDIGTGS